MGIELELAVLFLTQTLGYGILDPFEVETPPWRKIARWLIVGLITLLVYRWAGHWALLVPLSGAIAGGTFHYFWCRKHGIHPIHAAPRRKYYELRSWEWPD